MEFRIDNPCNEDWNAMERRPDGRYCNACEKTVVDLTRMTRAEATRTVERIARRDGEVCVQLALDPVDDAVFRRPPPSRARHWAGGLVLVAALTAGGCDADEAPDPCEVAEVVPEVDPGPPMTPAPMTPGAAITPPPAPTTGPVPAAEVNPVAASHVMPTAEQSRLTARKAEPVRPPIRHVRGRMPSHRFRGGSSPFQ